MPPPHPAFAVHFTDPIYEASWPETAPFGSDEGSDMVVTWGQRRDELDRDSSIADLMETDAAELDRLLEQMVGIDYLDQAAMARGAAFTLLRLVGHISLADRTKALRCIDYEIETFGDPAWLPAEARGELLPPLYVQREGLLAWRNPGP